MILLYSMIEKYRICSFEKHVLQRAQWCSSLWSSKVHHLWCSLNLCIFAWKVPLSLPASCPQAEDAPFKVFLARKDICSQSSYESSTYAKDKLHSRHLLYIPYMQHYATAYTCLTSSRLSPPRTAAAKATPFMLRRCHKYSWCILYVWLRLIESALLYAHWTPASICTLNTCIL